MIQVHPIELIVSDPSRHNGKLIISGTHVRLIDVLASYIYGRSTTPEELALNYTLTLAQVHAALAYYFQHKEEVELMLKNDVEEAERLLAELDAMGKLLKS
jgi:uncharacterized protein (DUF433 family)